MAESEQEFIRLISNSCIGEECQLKYLDYHQEKIRLYGESLADMLREMRYSRDVPDHFRSRLDIHLRNLYDILFMADDLHENVENHLRSDDHSLCGQITASRALNHEVVEDDSSPDTTTSASSGLEKTQD